MTRTRAAIGRCSLAVLVAVLIGGCGSSSTSTSAGGGSASAGSASSGAAARTTSTAAAPTPAIDDLAAAERPGVAMFPPADGRSLQQLGTLVSATVSLGAATGTFTPGTRRLAFGLTTSAGRYVYAPTAVYLARTATAPASGPFLAPIDSMVVAPVYRSEQNAGPGDISAIYAADVPVAHAGTMDVLSLTHGPHVLIGATGEIAVARSSPIPDVGQRAPAVATDTAATVHGDTARLTTRLPPEHMAAVSLTQVLGKRPVALLFSTPQLCTSRVCGPVTDVAVSLQRRFGSRIAFIHEEVYVDNQPNQGLRPQLKAFHLETEPWLFTINRRGIITARLEGAFGTAEMIRALQAALR